MAILAEHKAGGTVGQYLWSFALHIACVTRLYDTSSADVMHRFIYQRDFGTPGFAGAYDDQPAWWLDAQRVINQEIKALQMCRCQQCEKRRNGN